MYQVQEFRLENAYSQIGGVYLPVRICDDGVFYAAWLDPNDTVLGIADG